MVFLIPNLDIFNFSRNFPFRQNRECWFQIWYYFHIPAKNSQSDIFGPEFKDFYFSTKLCNKTNSNISNMTIAFWNSSPKTRKLGIFCPKFRHFCFFFVHEILQLDKFEALISNTISVWKYPNKAVFVLNVSFFYFSMKLRVLRNSRVLWFRKWQYFFPNSSKKYSNKKFSLKTQKFFLFKWNFEWT